MDPLAPIENTGQRSARPWGVVRKPWTREEVMHAIDAGLFRPGQRLELIWGEVFEKASPQKSPHATGALKAERALRTAFPSNAHVRSQLPLALSDFNEPEPDVAVVPGQIEDYVDEHPTSALLVVEVADSTLPFDRGTKASLYARSGIPEYWILDLQDRVLEVHRDPAPMVHPTLGHHYRSITRHAAEERVCPLARSEHEIRVGDLLP